MGPQNVLRMVVCLNVADAVARGFVYREPEYKPIEIEQAVVVGGGTVSGKSTVDLVLVDQTGQKFAVMLTGALMQNLAAVCAAMVPFETGPGASH